MDELENLIGKSVFEIDSEIINSLESINFKVAILEYKYKNCGIRYPANPLKLTLIDYTNVITFDELINFDKIFIFWHFKDQITDLEIFDISSDLNNLKSDYDLIKPTIFAREILSFLRQNALMKQFSLMVKKLIKGNLF